MYKPKLKFITFFFFFHEKHSCPEDQKTPVDTFSLKGNIYMRSQIIKDFQWVWNQHTWSNLDDFFFDDSILKTRSLACRTWLSWFSWLTVHTFLSFVKIFSSSDLSIFRLLTFCTYSLSILSTYSSYVRSCSTLFPDYNGYRCLPSFHFTAPLCSPNLGGLTTTHPQFQDWPSQPKTVRIILTSLWNSFCFRNQSEWSPGFLFDYGKKRRSFFLWMIWHWH